MFTLPVYTGHVTQNDRDAVFKDSNFKFFISKITL